MKVEILPAGVAPPSRKTPAPFTPRRGMTVQTMPQARPVLPVLANLKPNYVPPAVRAAMVKGQPPGFAYGIPTPGQLPVGVGSGMVRKFNPAVLGRGGGLDGFGAFGTASVIDGRECPATGSWGKYCDCMFARDTQNWKDCPRKGWGPFAGEDAYWIPGAATAISAPWTMFGMGFFRTAANAALDTAGNAVKSTPAGPTAEQVAMAERCPKIPGTNTLRPNFPGCPESNTGGSGGGSGGGGSGGSGGGSGGGGSGGSGGGSSTAEESNVGTIAIVAAGLAAAGGIGYLFLRGRRSTPIGSFSRRKARRGRK